MTTGMLLRDDLLFDTDETFGTGAAGDPELGFQVRIGALAPKAPRRFREAGRKGH